MYVRGGDADYHGWEYTAKAIAAAMNALGCSGHAEGDKTYSTSDYTYKYCM